MIDFSNCEINKYKYYGGRNGGKICVVYNGEDYMLKFPTIIDLKEENHKYSNSCISEHISCEIIYRLKNYIILKSKNIIKINYPKNKKLYKIK